MLIELCSVSKQAERCNTNDVIALCTSLASAKQEVGPYTHWPRCMMLSLVKISSKFAWNIYGNTSPSNFSLIHSKKAEEFLALVSALQEYPGLRSRCKLRDIFRNLKLSTIVPSSTTSALFFSRPIQHQSRVVSKGPRIYIHHDSGNVARPHAMYPRRNFQPITRAARVKVNISETRSLLQENWRRIMSRIRSCHRFGLCVPPFWMITQPPTKETSDPGQTARWT